MPGAGRRRGDLPRQRLRRLRDRRGRARRRLRDQVHGGDRGADARRRRARDAGPGPARCAGCCSPACWRWRASWSPTRTRCSTSTRSATASATSRRPRATAAASSASRPTAGSSTTSAPLTWGLGWLPALAALGGAIGLRCATGGWRSCSSRRRSLFLLFMGTQDRFFARWLLPVYPLLCLLAAWAVVAAAAGSRPGCGSGPRSSPACSAPCCARRASCSRSTTTVVLARPDTRQLARDWMVANVPIRSKVVVEPFVPAAWAADAQSVREGTGNGFRWNKWPTTRAPDDRGGGVIRSRTTSARTRPALLGAYARGGYCWVVTGSTQYGRAFAEPREVPDAMRYYAALERDAKLVYEVRPDEGGHGRLPFSFDFSFNAYPLSYDRMGPEVRDLPALAAADAASRHLSSRGHRDQAPPDRPRPSRARHRARRGRPRPDVAEPDGRRRRGPRRRGARRGLPHRPRPRPRRARGAARLRRGRRRRGDAVRLARALLPPRADPAVHGRDPRGGHRPRRGRLRRPDREGRRPRPRHPARRGRRGRGRRGRAGRTRPAAQPAVPQARPHRPPVGAVQVGDDARRQGRDPHRRLEVDLRRRLAPARAPLARGVRRRRVRHRHRARRRPAARRRGSRASTASRAGSCSTPRPACRSTPR